MSDATSRLVTDETLSGQIVINEVPTFPLFTLSISDEIFYVRLLGNLEYGSCHSEALERADMARN